MIRFGLVAGACCIVSRLLLRTLTLRTSLLCIPSRQLGVGWNSEWLMRNLFLRRLVVRTGVLVVICLISGSVSAFDTSLCVSPVVLCRWTLCVWLGVSLTLLVVVRVLRRPVIVSGRTVKVFVILCSAGGRLRWCRRLCRKDRTLVRCLASDTGLLGGLSGRLNAYCG